MTEVTRFINHGPVEIRKVVNGETWRGVKAPGDDLSDLPRAVRDAVNAHWTPERIAAFHAATVPEPQPEPAPAPEPSRAEKFDAFIRRGGLTAAEFLDEMKSRQAVR